MDARMGEPTEPKKFGRGWMVCLQGPRYRGATGVTRGNHRRRRLFDAWYWEVEVKFHWHGTEIVTHYPEMYLLDMSEDAEVEP